MQNQPRHASCTRIEMYLVRDVWVACNPVTYRKVREVGLGSHAPAYTERKFSDKNGQRRYSNLNPDICGRRPR